MFANQIALQGDIFKSIVDIMQIIVGASSKTWKYINSCGVEIHRCVTHDGVNLVTLFGYIDEESQVQIARGFLQEFATSYKLSSEMEHVVSQPKVLGCLLSDFCTIIQKKSMSPQIPISCLSLMASVWEKMVQLTMNRDEILEDLPFTIVRSISPFLDESDRGTSKASQSLLEAIFKSYSSKNEDCMQLENEMALYALDVWQNARTYINDLKYTHFIQKFYPLRDVCLQRKTENRSIDCYQF